MKEGREAGREGERACAPACVLACEDEGGGDRVWRE